MAGRKPVSIVEEPSLEEAVRTIEQSLSMNKMLIIVGECSVDYMGRASSKLKLGERFVIIKEDGSILVHRPKNYSPVNWHPAESHFEVQILKDKLLIKAFHRRFREVLKVFFRSVYLILVLDIVDKGEFTLYASEEDMQKAVLAHPEIIEKGFVPISYEKKVEPGFIDIYGIDSSNRLVVIEIKKKTAGRAAVLQLAKYLETIRGNSSRKVRGIIAAPALAKGVQQLLLTLDIEYKSLHPKKCAEILGQKNKTTLLDKYIP